MLSPSITSLLVVRVGDVVCYVGTFMVKLINPLTIEDVKVEKYPVSPEFICNVVTEIIFVNKTSG